MTEQVWFKARDLSHSVSTFSLMTSGKCLTQSYAYLSMTLRSCPLAQMADTAMSRLNTHLTELGGWLIKWKIKINSEKFQTVYFSRSRNQPFPPKLC
ncbi:hypothetical protein AVEN_72777-1 [Araneus ventricosus]|uniref:Reverse transcriptase domain-containing protein n=1 Tax=Araneus ventricosus TaxID=182803 RepID=A0A4Y2QIY3_ARAVE|nr:hypothetical protein AVEN_72777-1 [Araneus ventricosus]